MLAFYIKGLGHFLGFFDISVSVWFSIGIERDFMCDEGYFGCLQKFLVVAGFTVAGVVHRGKCKFGTFQSSLCSGALCTEAVYEQITFVVFSRNH